MHTETGPDRGPAHTYHLAKLQVDVQEAADVAVRSCKRSDSAKALAGIVHIGFTPNVSFPAISFSPDLQESLMSHGLFDCVRGKFKGLRVPEDHKPIFLTKSIVITGIK